MPCCIKLDKSCSWYEFLEFSPLSSVCLQPDKSIHESESLRYHTYMSFISCHQEESWAQNGTKSSCPQTYGIQPSCLMAALYTKASALNDVLWQKSVAYEISQLGTVSLFDLKHVILKHGLKPSTSYGGLIVHRHLRELLHFPMH